ncbi:hypothetical protein COOONC_05828 [Cooperia oncophora]
MKLLALAFCVCLAQVSFTSKEYDLGLSFHLRHHSSRLRDQFSFTAALRAQKVPPEAQTLTGERLVKYLKENQKLFEVATKPTIRNLKSRVMDPKYSDQGPATIVMHEDDINDDIPERSVKMLIGCITLRALTAKSATKY